MEGQTSGNQTEQTSRTKLDANQQFLFDQCNRIHRGTPPGSGILIELTYGDVGRVTSGIIVDVADGGLVLRKTDGRRLCVSWNHVDAIEEIGPAAGFLAGQAAGVSVR
jgi:hypothetical protein